MKQSFKLNLVGGSYLCFLLSMSPWKNKVSDRISNTLKIYITKEDKTTTKLKL